MTHATPNPSTVDTFHLTRAQQILDLLRTFLRPEEQWQNHPDVGLYYADRAWSTANDSTPLPGPYQALTLALRFALRRLVETDEQADRLHYLIIDNGEDVAYNVRALSQEIRYQAEENARLAAEDAAYRAGVRAAELVAADALGTAPADAEPSPDVVVVRDPLLDVLDRVADERPAVDLAPGTMRHVMGADWLDAVAREVYGQDVDQA